LADRFAPLLEIGPFGRRVKSDCMLPGSVGMLLFFRAGNTPYNGLILL
jgi:hypothetical protein